MLETISEWAVIYFKVGAIAGFGIGAIAQLLSARITGDWTLRTCLTLACFWPMLILDVIAAKLKK